MWNYYVSFKNLNRLSSELILLLVGGSINDAVSDAGQTIHATDGEGIVRLVERND